MPQAWTFIDATAFERVAFADLPSTLALAEESPVLPPNRWRSVHRVHAPDGGVYWLKRFHRTQWKNRLHNRLTAPHCSHDAEREVLMAAALRAGGFRTARVVALMSDGAASACLLASLEGESLADAFAQGGLDRARLLAGARFAAAISTAGFVLPDLSLDHVFRRGDGESPDSFGVIDLHRGRRGRARPRDLVRLLRRAAKSASGLAIPRALALRAAVSFLRHAGHGRAVREVIGKLPPFDTHGRYDAAARARRYGSRSSARDARERSLLASIWPFAPGSSLLDLPCGRGRLRDLCEERGARWHGADRSRAMLAEARGAAAVAKIACADAASMPFADRAFDGVIVFRFLHHLRDEAARAVCQEAARVADDLVLVSFFHPISGHHLMRLLRAKIRQRPHTRFARSLGTIDAWFEATGFRRIAAHAESAYRRDLWLAVYRRRRGPTARSAQVDA